MILFRLLLGIALLVMGRRLFWLFLGGIGFIYGFDFAKATFHNQSQTVILLIALTIGALGALVAIFLQKFAIVGGGFVAGGYLLLELLKIADVSTGDYHWALFLVGGLIGAILMSFLFGWTLIVLSSVVGAVLISQTLHLGHQWSQMLFIALVIAGIAIQIGIFRKKP